MGCQKITIWGYVVYESSLRKQSILTITSDTSSFTSFKPKRKVSFNLEKNEMWTPKLIDKQKSVEEGHSKDSVDWFAQNTGIQVTRKNSKWLLRNKRRNWPINMLSIKN